MPAKLLYIWRVNFSPWIRFAVRPRRIDCISWDLFR